MCLYESRYQHETFSMPTASRLARMSYEELCMVLYEGLGLLSRAQANKNRLFECESPLRRLELRRI